MKRPNLGHFLCVETSEHFAFKASLFLKSANPMARAEIASTPLGLARDPAKSLSMLRAYKASLKILALNENGEVLWQDHFSSDAYGHCLWFKKKNTLSDPNMKVQAFTLFETGYRKGLELHLGSTYPWVISERPTKVIICDFDKTLVETKYSTTKEMYLSLTSPLIDFPIVYGGLNILKHFTSEGFRPFILSASPHFYEVAIRDWLYQQEFYQTALFLKDYRQFYTWWGDGPLESKDIKYQGLYKLDQLITSVLMSSLPEELVLVGDQFESDPIIYALFHELYLQKVDAWTLWKTIESEPAFRLTIKQNSHLLNRLYYVENALKARKVAGRSCQIFIRKAENKKPKKIPKMLSGVEIVYFDGKVGLKK
jgi:hypothetical protein